MIRLWIEPSGEANARLEFDRPDRGFSERDRAVLDLLLPHLRRSRANAVARRRPIPQVELTPREREILELVAEGRTNADVAGVLWISPATARKHLENAYAKLGVHSRTAAVARINGRFPPDSAEATARSPGRLQGSWPCA